VTEQALAGATSLVEGTLNKDLKKFLKSSIKEKDAAEKLAVADTKLGGVIKEKTGLQIISNDMVRDPGVDTPDELEYHVPCRYPHQRGWAQAS
jgi:hypothetical protein